MLYECHFQASGILYGHKKHWSARRQASTGLAYFSFPRDRELTLKSSRRKAQKCTGHCFHASLPSDIDRYCLPSTRCLLSFHYFDDAYAFSLMPFRQENIYFRAYRGFYFRR